MIVHFTRNAHQNLGAIYDYHADYDLEYADNFQDQITEFISDNISDFPEIGTLYNAEKSLRRFVWGKFNIYYLLKDDVAYVLFIIAGKIHLNTELEAPDVALPPLA